jgi:hypothetical protein
MNYVVTLIVETKDDDHEELREELDRIELDCGIIHDIRVEELHD